MKQDDEFKILKVLESDTAIVDGNLYSDRDFEEEFIEFQGMHFLYIRTRISGSGGIVEVNVYTISSDQKLSTIPFQDVSKSTILKESEELRNGGYRFAEGAFTFESGFTNHKMANVVLRWGTFMLSTGWKESSRKTHTTTLLSQSSSSWSQTSGEATTVSLIRQARRR